MLAEKFGTNERKICFERIIPMPPQVYRGERISREDDDDFGDLSPLKWKRKNWGTKWNAYSTSMIEFDNKVAAHPVTEIWFDTAWSIPYPIIIAIANILHDVDFVYEYFDEGHNFWGREKWSKQNRVRFEIGEELKKELCLKLKKYDPDQMIDD